MDKQAMWPREADSNMYFIAKVWHFYCFLKDFIKSLPHPHQNISASKFEILIKVAYLGKNSIQD